MSKPVTGLSLICCIIVLLCDGLAIGQTGGREKWKSPDGKVLFVVPNNFRKQRSQDSDPRIGYWKSKDKNSKLEFYVAEGLSSADLNRPQWDRLFFDETNGSLTEQNSIAKAGYEVWVTMAKRKDSDSKEKELQQAALVIDDKVYMLRSECSLDAKKDTREKVKKAIYSLAKAPLESEQITGPQGLQGATWKSASGDFSMFIPISLGKKESTDPEVIGEWYSFALGIQIRGGKRPAPQRHQYDSVISFKNEFRTGFRSEMKDVDVQFREIRHDGREIWTADYETEMFGVITKGRTWVFRVQNNLYVLAVGYDPDIPEGVKVVNSIFESVEFRRLETGDTGDILGQTAQDNRKPDFGRLTGRIAGMCIMFLVGAWIWYRQKR